MLAAALASARTALAAHHLAEQASGVVGEGQVVTVATMVAEHNVAVGFEGRDDADGVGLLADAGVRGANEFSG